MKRNHLIINLEEIKKYETAIVRQEIFNKGQHYQAQTVLLYGYYFKENKQPIEEQVFKSNHNFHHDLIVVNNLLEHLPPEFLSVVIKDVFSYSSKHVMIILNFKSNMFKPVVNQLSKYPRHSFYFNQ